MFSFTDVTLGIKVCALIRTGVFLTLHFGELQFCSPRRTQVPGGPVLLSHSLLYAHNLEQSLT
jgi:hypothetical protein